MPEEVPPFPIDMTFVDEFGKKLDASTYEPHEMELAWKYIKPNDVVLELGARVGCVSCTIARRLQNSGKSVAVEPDCSAIFSLQRNKMKNNCEFHIYPGFVSKKPLSLKEHHVWTNSYYDPQSTMDRCTLEELQQTTGCTFTVLVADCEGFLESFYDENPWFFDQIRLIIYERDAPMRCNYKHIEEGLTARGFKEIVNGFNCVWTK